MSMSGVSSRSYSGDVLLCVIGKPMLYTYSGDVLAAEGLHDDGRVEPKLDR